MCHYGVLSGARVVGLGGRYSPGVVDTATRPGEGSFTGVLPKDGHYRRKSVWKESGRPVGLLGSSWRVKRRVTLTTGEGLLTLGVQQDGSGSLVLTGLQ